ncbi:hypothetical protein NPIL_37231 [Nephila pilipes]|uniref:Uncharacterized protein n=1 Tax=Nephila pilipes TaxID=299642 RepID=A0A8X6TB52_NEPPI|nr:hypothetical protein NPIL_37231 [Nephila pilipes]
MAVIRHTEKLGQHLREEGGGRDKKQFHSRSNVRLWVESRTDSEEEQKIRISCFPPFEESESSLLVAEHLSFDECFMIGLGKGDEFVCNHTKR